ncbi:MAG: zinc ABC transporter substrate-binding protein [Pseudomonadota bacterium]
MPLPRLCPGWSLSITQRVVAGFCAASAVAAPLSVLGTDTAWASEAPRVVADLPPVHGLVAAVMGERGAPELLLPIEADPQRYVSRPDDVAVLESAAVVVTLGDALTPAMAPMLVALTGETEVLDLSALDGLVQRRAEPDADGAREIALQDEAAAFNGWDKAGDVDAVGPLRRDAPKPRERDGPDGAPDGHALGTVDPHLWLDPENAVLFVEAIAASLSTIDPDGAADYARNAEAATARIRGAMSLAALRLEPVAGKPFVTDHASTGYLSERFGLGPSVAVRGVFGDDPDTARAAAVSASSYGARCVFVEQDPVSPLALTIAEEVGAEVVAIDPLGREAPPGPEHYPTLLTTLAETIAACLSRAD